MRNRLMIGLLSVVGALACSNQPEVSSEPVPPAAAAPEVVVEPAVPSEPAAPAPVEVADPEAAPAAAEGEAAAVDTAAANSASGPGTYVVAARGEASFLIDAPLEKIKGRWTRFGGELTVDGSDLTKTRGEITIALSDLKTHTFGNPGKDAKQGAHAKNWMEIGDEVDAATRAKNDRASFRITSIKSATPQSFADGASAKITAEGKLILHGRTVAKTVELTVTAEGPAAAPTAIKVATRSPMQVSLSGHDIKPRDLAGRFLAGALDRIGQKIADASQVSVQLTANRK